MKTSYRYHPLDLLAYLLMVICFPLNPLVLLNVIDPYENDLLLVLGFVIWAIGMFFVIYPVFYFRIKGDVPLGKSFVHTNRVVTKGLYSIVRHVQYTGGILSIFIATPLLYPHWIFVLLAIPGIWLTYLGTQREDRMLIEKFGEPYRNYMRQVPSVNILAGIYRRLKSKTLM